jgi:hypothetical protein
MRQDHAQSRCRRIIGGVLRKRVGVRERSFKTRESARGKFLAILKTKGSLGTGISYLYDYPTDFGICSLKPERPRF